MVVSLIIILFVVTLYQLFTTLGWVQRQVPKAKIVLISNITLWAVSGTYLIGSYIDSEHLALPLAFFEFGTAVVGFMGVLVYVYFILFTRKMVFNKYLSSESFVYFFKIKDAVNELIKHDQAFPGLIVSITLLFSSAASFMKVDVSQYQMIVYILLAWLLVSTMAMMILRLRLRLIPFGRGSITTKLVEVMRLCVPVLILLLMLGETNTYFGIACIALIWIMIIDRIMQLSEFYRYKQGGDHVIIGEAQGMTILFAILLTLAKLNVYLVVGLTVFAFTAAA